MQVFSQLQLSSKAKIILTHVVTSDRPDDQADRPKAEGQDLYHRIEQQLKAYREALPCTSELEIVTGDPVEEIIRLANIYQSDLIVLGSRGLTGLSRILQGSVSGQVVAEAPCSVLVIKANRESTQKP